MNLVLHTYSLSTFSRFSLLSLQINVSKSDILATMRINP